MIICQRRHKKWFEKISTEGEVTHRVVSITPEMAIEALGQNTANRKMMPRHTTFLANEIRCGRWILTGDSIKFASTGELIDGQHRLHAIIEAATPVESVVVTGLEPLAKEAIDGGHPRKVGENLHIFAIPNGNAVAAVVPAIVNYLEGRNPFSYRGHHRMGTKETLEQLAKHPQIVSSVTESLTLRRVLLQSVGGFCHFIFSAIDPVLTEDWRSAMQHGSGLKEGDPWHTLRERLLAERATKRKLPREYLAAFCVQAWNCKRDKRSMAICRYAPSNDENAFPRAK